MKVLNIGCGLDKYGETRLDIGLSRLWDVVGLDKENFGGVDIIHDLNTLPLPFKDNEFDMVYSSHVLEHIINTDLLLVDIHRILKPDGIFKAILPHRTNPSSYSHHHIKHWSMTSFDDINKNNTVSRLTGLFQPTSKIKLIKPFHLIEPIINKMPYFYEWRLSWLIPAVEVHFELRAIK